MRIESAESDASGDDAVLDERGRLMSLAYRMLGTIAEAEDAVQETLLRWYRLSDAQRAAIDNPAAWVTRVAGRVCLDMLGSARARREQYVGEWLPEPVPAAGSPSVGSRLSAASAAEDPLERAELDETVAAALLVVLETMTPAERVAFVLHDVFAVPFGDIADEIGRTPAAVRQLASAARRRAAGVGSGRRAISGLDSLVEAFGSACRTGDLATLATVLDPSVVLRNDGGGLVRAALRPVIGADHVARFLLGVLAKHPGTVLERAAIVDGTGYALRADGVVWGVLTIAMGEQGLSTLWLQVNPEKLALWRD